MYKKIIFGIIGCSMMLLAYFLINGNQSRTNWAIVNRIIEKTDSHGNLVDFDKEFDVASSEDVAYSFKKGKLMIYFGKTTLELGKQDLDDDEFIKALEKAGITISKSKDGKYIVQYKGEDIDRWVE